MFLYISWIALNIYYSQRCHCYWFFVLKSSDFSNFVTLITVSLQEIFTMRNLVACLVFTSLAVTYSEGNYYLVFSLIFYYTVIMVSLSQYIRWKSNAHNYIVCMAIYCLRVHHLRPCITYQFLHYRHFLLKPHAHVKWDTVLNICEIR